MSFNLLVATCACDSQKLRYEPKDGAPIIIDATNQEHVIFFEIDEKSNPISLFREHFNMNQQGIQICDLLIYYYLRSNKRKITSDKKIICLAESKSSSIEDGIKQISDTYDYIIHKFSNDSQYYKNIIWCAYIATNRYGSSPTMKRKENRKQFREVPGFTFSSISTETDIGVFLRKIADKVYADRK